MGVVLARIDDRLIHGQVTVGWCQQLRPDRILLADNAIAADEWQSEIYRCSVPPSTAVSVLSIAESVAHLKSRAAGEERILVLTGSVFAMAELVRLGAPISLVNVGGLHFAAGKKELFPFVYLDPMDLRSLRRLLDLGAELRAQQVPGGRDFPLDLGHVLEMEARF
ncbi:MAG: PTS system mannose/fructose/N-acetylgalactosamine-transporter subunit IIB [Candidatus Krumholzibacteriia bacterium]